MLPSPLPAPDGTTSIEWSVLLELNPAAAAARWLRSQAGVNVEVEGPNRGPWLRRVLPYASAVDGLPYCARVVVAALDAAGCDRIDAHGKHWFWANGKVSTLEQGCKAEGIWAGPLVPPREGWLVFHDNRIGSDKGAGGHVDLVIGYDAGERELLVVGANVGNTVKERRFRLGHPSITGFGAPRRKVTT